MNTIGSAAPPALENRTLREQVTDHLREEILSNRLPAGSELGEVALARSLGVSRGPLREALGQLAAEGLVTMVPRRGAVVKQFTRKDFVDAYEVRGALESLAIRLAVPRLTDAAKTRLHQLCKEMELAAAGGETELFSAINMQFHTELVIASGNTKLAEVHGQLMAQMGRLTRSSVELRGGTRKSAAEHRLILQAVDAGDPLLASRLLEEHIQVPLQILRSSTVDSSFDEQADAQEGQEDQTGSLEFRG